METPISRPEFIDFYEDQGPDCIFPDNVLRLISEGDLRQCMGRIAASVMFSKFQQSIIAAATMRACGGTPISLISTPGANKFHSIQKVTMSKKAGSVAYNFTDSIVLKTVGGEDQFYIAKEYLNTVAAVNMDLIKMGQQQVANVAFIITTLDGFNASQGDGNIQFTVYHTDEDVLIV